MGLLTAKDSPDVYTEVLRMIDRHYSPELIRKRKEHVLHRLQVTREERAVATVIDGHQVEE